jgi:hypothetical protein
MPRGSEARSFRYQKRDKENVRERANMRGGNFDTLFKPQYKLYKMREGKNIIRILPPTWDDAKHYGYDIYVNYNIGVDNQSYLSLSKMKNEKDPLAEAKKQADRDGDKKLSKALNPTQRILMWVIDRQDEDEGPQLFNCPFTLDKAIANLSFDEDTKEVVFIDDPENGCDVRFYKEGTGLKTDYDASKMKILKPSPLCEDEGLQDEWLQFVQDNSLPDVLNFCDYDHIAGVFDGNIGSRGGDDDEEEKPRRRASRDDDEDEQPRRRPAARDEDDDPPFERPTRRRPAAEDDEVEVDEKPTKRTTKGDDEEDQPKTSIRDRLASRRSRIEDED